MMFDDAKEVHDLPALVVDNFISCRLAAAEEDAAHADEGLAVAVMFELLDLLADRLCQTALAADPRGETIVQFC